jgi:KDO2-lipid IV(A) lauroyltransferase
LSHLVHEELPVTFTVKTRSQLRNWTEYLLARTVVGCVGALPRRWGLGLAHLVAHGLRRAVPRLSQVAQRNAQLVDLASRPDAGPALEIGVFDSVARLLWVTAIIASNTSNSDAKRLQLLGEFVSIEGLEIVQEALALGRGVLFATGHMGNWELSALAFGAMVTPMDVMARPLDNPLLDRWMTGIRESTGNRVLAKSGTLREVMRALQHNRAVGFLIDHNVISPDRCFIRFLGVEASASAVFAKIAARSGAAVIPGFCVWEAARQRYVLRFYPRVHITGDAQADTQRIHSCLETVIRQYPHQWLWIHRRFKTRPDGEPDLYSELR